MRRCVPAKGGSLEEEVLSPLRALGRTTTTRDSHMMSFNRIVRQIVTEFRG